MNYTDEQLKLKSLRLRRSVLKWVKHAGAGHTGGSLSCIDILNVLYNRILNVSPQDFSSPDRDRYIQSKGHSVEALFVVLADRGFFQESELETMCRYQSHFIGHPTRKVPGVEQNTGGLGHGLSIGVGTALAAELDKKAYRTFVLLGDGELAEGSNWEAAMSAAHYGLDNLTAIIDCNSLQIAGRTRDVMNSEPLGAKWSSFGWSVSRIDGHDYGQLTEALAAPLKEGQPSMIIADTIKGSGVDFMEGVGKWHHGVPNDEEYSGAMAAFDAQLSELEGVLS
ncbi:Transketolase, thiamine diphosphate binding domain, putative [Verrucomicrobiia bacterium DG1235]|nr:Transketolase, thiamine diphosphate binding domain, putative [Verrucomicrobiae bacterium DG1235]